MNKCFRCQEYLAAEMFRIRADTGRPRRVCKACENADNLRRFHGDPKTRSAHRKAAYTSSLKKHGLTAETHQALREAHGGACAICKVPEADTRFGVLSVDHCHTSGAVRGLLCTSCNTALGFLKEDPALFARAAEYVTSGGFHAR